MMYQQKLKKRVISILFVLFVLLVFCSAITVTRGATASAESYNDQTAELYSEQTTSNMENLSAPMPIILNGDSTPYKNLGNTLRAEGYQIDGKPLTDLYYIENANYFIANPKHHDNDGSDNVLGTCTTVALQLLVGYHNYYSDRRLLPQYSKDGTQLLENNYGTLTEHPTIKYDTSRDNGSLGRDSIGTADGVYHRIYDETIWPSFPGLGQNVPAVVGATRKFLEEDSELTNWTLTSATYNRSKVISELNAGRPVVVGFDYFQGHTAHVVVAYGYTTYDGELCFVTHYGHRGDKVQMLVPESWLEGILGYCVTMNINHQHTFEDTGETYKDASGTEYRALKCSACGSVTLDYKYIPSMFGGGGGTLSDPFLIRTPEQFRNMGAAYHSVYVPGQGSDKRIDYAFKLMNDITISGDWTTFSYSFSGDFDGNGHSIKYSMILTQSDINANEYQGLFGFVVTGGKIHDLTLNNCSITSDTGTTLSRSDYVNIGIVAGSCYEAYALSNVKVNNPKIECKISNAFIGGLAGSLSYGVAENCTVGPSAGAASITNNANYSYIGGLAGYGNSLEQFRGCSVRITLTNTAFNGDTDAMGKVISEILEEDPDWYYKNYEITTNVDLKKGGGPCVAEGTLVTLADGTQKAVEELTKGEELLVWNFVTGQLDTAPILFVDSEPACVTEVVTLLFSDGTEVRVIGEHGFWDYTLNRYVYLDAQAEDYIGHSFAYLNGDTLSRVTLESVTIGNEYTVAYSPVTYSHLCYYVNGMLSMPGGIEGLFNIFDVDADTMRYDEAAMQEDIQTYGLYTYEEFSELVPVSEEVFEAFNGQYLKVAIGKGLIDLDRLNDLAARYAKFFA